MPSDILIVKNWGPRGQGITHKHKHARRYAQKELGLRFVFGTHNIVDGAEDLFDLSNLSLVLQEYGGVEVRDLRKDMSSILVLLLALHANLTMKLVR